MPFLSGIFEDYVTFKAAELFYPHLSCARFNDDRFELEVCDVRYFVLIFYTMHQFILDKK